MATCTITTTAAGATCGAPAVLTFGKYAECAVHARPIVVAPKAGVAHPFVRRPYTRVECATCGKHLTAKVHG